MPPRRRNPNTPRNGRRRMPIPVIDFTTRSRSTAYEDNVLRQVQRAAPQAPVSRAVDAGSAAPAQAEARQALRPRVQLAMTLAEAGDDILLMPYQPTPTINPGRPRTRAIGYDADTRTMWIRFRESNKDPAGAVYAYYGVEPRQWRNIKRVVSPGRFLNRNIIDKYEYARTNL